MPRTLTLMQRLREAFAHRPTLHDLDDRTLRDLGIHRSEIASIEAEHLIEDERTRLRIVPRCWAREAA